MGGGCSRELCSILNEAIREDDHDFEGVLGVKPIPKLLAPAVPFVCMLQYHLNAGRRAQDRQMLWPDGKNSDEAWTVFRGSGLPESHQGFFRNLQGKDQWYRVPHPLATSFVKHKAYDFMRLQPDKQPKVLWIIKIDPSLKCMNVNFMDKTEVEGEHEFLFSAYSAFRVLEYKEPQKGNGSDLADPIKVTILAHDDNYKAPEDVPSAPWH